MRFGSNWKPPTRIVGVVGIAGIAVALSLGFPQGQGGCGGQLSGAAPAPEKRTSREKLTGDCPCAARSTSKADGEPGGSEPSVVECLCSADLVLYEASGNTADVDSKEAKVDCTANFGTCVQSLEAGEGPDAPTCAAFHECYEQKSQCANALCADERAAGADLPGDGNREAIEGSSAASCKALLEACMAKPRAPACDLFRAQCLATEAGVNNTRSNVKNSGGL